MKFVLVITAVLLAYADAQPTRKCMDCICQIESNCNENVGCVMDEGSLSCGAYQIKDEYWQDCGRLDGSWMGCSSNIPCSERCVYAYMDRYGFYCTGGRQPKCEDYARIHNRGPQGCNSAASIGYWEKVRACCGGQNGCD